MLGATSPLFLSPWAPTFCCSIPSGGRMTPQAASAAASSATSCSVCAADSATRSREVPSGTVGGLIAGTWKPARSSATDAASAASAAPAFAKAHD